VDENQRGVGRPSPRFRGDRERKRPPEGQSPYGEERSDDWF
jgi:hypothetical protein